MRALMAAALASLVAGGAMAQTKTCGVNPPGPPPVRTVAPYAGEPEDLQPFSKFAKEPYFRNYIETNVYVGAGRDVPDPQGLTEIRIGFLGPLGEHPEHALGMKMLNGAELAVEEANAAGGYCGVPFRLMVHNDYDNWQVASAATGGVGRESTIWGSASNDVVKMVYDEKVWAIFGSISSESTHIALRVALRAEIPIVNSASTDPTIPETLIPWYFTDLQDDRVQSLTLARHIYTELGLKRMAILRVNNRYGRFGVAKFRDASRRLGHPVVIEQKFMPGDTDYSQQLRVINESRVDGVLLWTDQEPAAAIVKQMRAMGMKQRVFGGYRILGDTLVKNAGAAAEGVEAVFPYDPTREDARWTDFQARYEAKYQEKPEAFASLAYDAMQVLLASIEKAGLNRARIHDAMAQVYEYDGVTGHMVFDPNSKNVAPMYLGTVHHGDISYRRVTMERTEAERPENAASPQAGAVVERVPEAVGKPYARVGEDGVSYFGPATSRMATTIAAIAVVGPDAERAVHGAAVEEALAAASRDGVRLELVPVASNQEWGKASTGLAAAVFDRHVLGMISLDRDASHLAEQLSLKGFVPVIALSEDRALTSTNVPWIFRLPPESELAAAVNCYVGAMRQAGPDAGRIRAVLASGSRVGGVAFRTNGEPE